MCSNIPYPIDGEILAETEVQRTRIEPDQDYNPHDFWALETEEETYAAAEAEAQLIQDVGVWGIVLERKCPACGAWQAEDEVWGCVPNGEGLRSLAEAYGLLPEGVTW